MSKELSPRFAALLPPASVAKYNRLLETVFTYAAASRAAYDAELELQDRRMKVRTGVTGPRDEAERDALVDDLTKKLEAARERTQRARAPFECAARLCDSLREVVVERARSGNHTTFKAHPVYPVTSSDPVAEIADLRRQLLALDAEEKKITSSPLPAVVIKQRITETINAIAKTGMPTISSSPMSEGPVNIHRLLDFTSNEFNRAPTGGAPFFVWLLRDEIVAKLHAMVEHEDLPAALTDEERRRAVAGIAARRVKLERREEAIIVWAENHNITIPRRPDVSPYIVLEIEE